MGPRARRVAVTFEWVVVLYLGTERSELDEVPVTAMHREQSIAGRWRTRATSWKNVLRTVDAEYEIRLRTRSC